MSLTKLTRKLVALATDVHIRSLRAALFGYGKQTAAANYAWDTAIRLERDAEQRYHDAKAEQEQAILRYNDEVLSLGRNPEELG